MKLLVSFIINSVSLVYSASVEVLVMLIVGEVIPIPLAVLTTGQSVTIHTKLAVDRDNR